MLFAIHAASAGCVIPPELTRDEARDHRPVILRDNAQPPPGSVAVVEQSAPGSPPTVLELFVPVRDPDSTSLTMRIFVDANYRAFLQEVVQDNVSQQTFFNISITGPCDAIVNRTTGVHLFQAYVSDTGFVDRGNQLNVERPGGGRDEITWRVSCVPPSATGDAGAGR